MASTAFSRNIKELRTEAKMTQEQLAEAIGVTVVTVHNWETGKSDKPRQADITTRIKDYFSVDETDLFGYADGYYAKKYGLSDMPNGAVAVKPSGATMVPIRILGAAHAGVADVQWEFDGEAMLYSELAQKHPKCFALMVNGTCMNLNFTDHDVIFVDPELEPTDGSIGVISVDGDVIVRRVKRGNNSLILVAESTDPDSWPDQFYQGNGHEIRSIGTVFWWQATEEQV